MKEIVKTNILRKIETKLYKQGLTERKAALIGVLDYKTKWNNSKNPHIKLCKDILEKTQKSAVIFSIPKEPYNTIINYLAEKSEGSIIPKDSETRLFLHEIPVVSKFSSAKIIRLLKTKRFVVIPSSGIITTGSISLEQAFIYFSSICFSCFVKFFIDFLYKAVNRKIILKDSSVFKKAAGYLNTYPENTPQLLKGPFKTKDSIISAISEAGKLLIKNRLVDSCFGNISYIRNNDIYITQTSSYLDELKNNIDICPLDGSSCESITASSEFSTHKKIFLENNAHCVLHGHPKFSVILSMFCEHYDCANKDNCNKFCLRKRHINDIPIVSGEIGSGKYGINKTVPKALKESTGVIVYGHGVFTSSKIDFNSAFDTLLKIEKKCRQRYFDIILNSSGKDTTDLTN